MTTSPADHDSAAAVLRRSPELRWFLLGRFTAATAYTALSATVAWQVWRATESLWCLGAIGFAYLPSLPVGLIAGALADTRERRTIQRISITASGSVALALCLCTSLSGTGLWWLYALLVVHGISSAFEHTSRSSMLPSLVRRRDLPRAVILGSTAQNLAWLTGPVCSGLLIRAHSVSFAYAVLTGLYALAWCSLFGIRTRRPASSGPAVSWSAIRDGWTFVRQHPVLLAAMSLDMVAVIFASVLALLPVYATRLDVGAGGYGVLSAALEAGTVIMTLVLLGCRPIRRPGRALLLAVATFGLATGLFGLSHSFPLSLACLVVAGMADQISMVARSTLLQLTTPDALLGRVSAVNLVFVGASNQLGRVESGAAAGLTSPTVAVVGGGALCVLFVGIVTLRVPRLRTFRPPSGPETPSASSAPRTNRRRG